MFKFSESDCQRILIRLIGAITLFVGGTVVCAAQGPVKTPNAQAAPQQPDLESAFRSRDQNADGRLTEEEFVVEGNRDAAVLRRDFKVFDFDGDGHLNLTEFLALPYLGAPAQRGVVPDPAVLLAEARWKELSGKWSGWDADGDAAISAHEFAASRFNGLISGLEATAFHDWDLNRDGKVSRDEAQRVLQMAYGVCLPTGELLRLKTGSVVDWPLFRRADPDGDGNATREDYFRVMGHIPDWETWYRSIDKNNDGKFDYAEFSTSNHRTDPVAAFLHLDTDLDGQLSHQELEAVPVLRPLVKFLFPGFDDDGDGALSLREYQLTPVPTVDVLAPWQSAQDVNSDGKLSAEEFRFVPPPALSALSIEYFKRLDRNSDGFLTLDEWPFSTSHAQTKFRALDADADGVLTEVEFSAEGSLPDDRLSRDFRLFDADADNRMTLDEFLTLPYWVPEDQRAPLRDSLVALMESRMQELASHWSEWDRDGDGTIALSEYSAAAFGRRIPGLEMTGFDDWDANRDGKVSREEAKLLLEVAYGIRLQTGELLRLKTGSVVDWQLFRRLDPAGNGRVRREEYFRLLQGVENVEGWYRSIDKNNDGTFDFAEFMTSNHRTDPVGTFLAFDRDLNGRLTPDELTGLPADQPPLAKYLFPGFDEDRDGGLSLKEWLLTPLPTLHVLASWQTAQDSNHDGKLSPGEFRFMPGPALSALSAEFFNRLDTNHDGFLDLDEWVFVIDPGRAPRNVVLKLHDRDGDGRLSLDEVLGNLIRPQPGDRADPALEAARMRIEEAFRNADVDRNGTLDLRELGTSDGLEAIAPGAGALSKQASNLASPVTKFFGLEETRIQAYLIVGFNIVLIVAVAIYLIRGKRERST